MAEVKRARVKIPWEPFWTGVKSFASNGSSGLAKIAPLQGGTMKKARDTLYILIIAIPAIALLSCTGAKSDTVQEELIQSISSLEQFNAIIEHSGNKLIAFDLYADWCMPCHVLEPVLNEIAKENISKVTIYKINADQFPQIIEAFGVNGIPFVVFIKNKKAIYALMGVQPKESYIKIINSYADTSSEKIKEPDGKRIEGLKIKNDSYQNYLLTFQSYPL